MNSLRNLSIRGLNCGGHSGQWPYSLCKEQASTPVVVTETKSLQFMASILYNLLCCLLAACGLLLGRSSGSLDFPSLLPPGQDLKALRQAGKQAEFWVPSIFPTPQSRHLCLVCLSHCLIYPGPRLGCFPLLGAQTGVRGC
jgi:hypothetical protein